MTSHADRAISADALLGTEPRLLTSAERRGRLQALQQLAARVEAAQLATLFAECGAEMRQRFVVVDAPSDADAEREAHVFGRGPGQRGPRLATGERQLVFTDEVVDELAVLLHRTHGSVAHDLRNARLLHGPLSSVGDSLAAGRITAMHARALCRQAGRMRPVEADTDPQAAAAFAALCVPFQQHLLPIAESSTHGRTESQAERLVARLDAAAERQRRQRAKSRIGVWAQSEGDGLTSISATLASIDAARVMAAVDAHAEAGRQADQQARQAALAQGEEPAPRLTIGQHRAQALLGMLGFGSSSATASGTSASGTSGTSGTSASGASVRAEICVLIDAATFLGATADAVDLPAWVRVGGQAQASIDRDDLLALLNDPAVHTTLRRLITDPITGALVDRGAHSYVPSPELVAWLAARDEGCRFPGCPARACRCDVDHARNFAAGGSTTIAETGLLCRRHHNGKTHGGWRIEESHADGSCVFVSPDGSRHRHRPVRITDPPTLGT